MFSFKFEYATLVFATGPTARGIMVDQVSTAAPGIVNLGFSSGQDTSIAAFSPFLGAFDLSIKRKVLPPFV